jgi:Family of unknown function (DUF6152)
MKSPKFAVLTVVAGLLFSALPAMAHHSFTAVFDFSKPVTLHGTVITFEFINPHGWVTLDAKKDDGSTERWRVEVSNPNQLLREGWRKDILKPGDVITIDAYRAKDGTNTGNGRSFTLADGRKLFSPGGPDSPDNQANKPQ